MSSKALVRVIRKDEIAVVTLDRPEALNALSRALIAELDEALAALDADPAVKVLILTGAGRHFGAGADVKDMLAMTALEMVASDFSGSSRALAQVKKPVVAAVEGMAVGGACELVEMCDVVLASETARFGHPEITLAAMPGAGGTQRLSRLVGKHAAMELFLTGRLMTAEEAAHRGLVSRVIPPERLLDEAKEVAARIASFSAPVVRLIKEAVNHAFRGSLPDGLDFERRLFHLASAAEDRVEGMRAFVEKRTPKFSDR
jgi:enoyl-CoA hydratase